MRKHVIAMVGVTLATLWGPAFAQTTVVTPAPPAPPQPPPVVVQQAPAPQPAPEPARVEVNAQAPQPAPVVVNNSGGGGGENREVMRTSRALVGTGFTLFGVTYLSTIIAAAVTSDVCMADAALGCREAAWPIYIPVLGPFIQMGYVSGTGANSARALLAIDGALQGAGLGMAIAGIVMHTSAMVSKPAYSKLHVVPSNVGSGTGLVALGRF